MWFRRMLLYPTIFFYRGAQTLDLQQKFLRLEQRVDKLALALCHHYLRVCVIQMCIEYEGIAASGRLIISWSNRFIHTHEDIYK